MTSALAPGGTTTLDEDRIRAAFDRTRPLTVGVEEEVLLLDPTTHLPVPLADEVVRAVADPRVKRELPACQVELVTAAHSDVASALAELIEARSALQHACAGSLAPAAAAVHPTCAADGPVPTDRANGADGTRGASGADERYREIVATYGEVARRQVVGALQVHVALGGADRSLAVYNALRGYLPELAALAASAPFHEGRDTGLASIRPLIAGQLPRQGVPPAIPSWAALARDLDWGARSGSVPDPGQWWWELRPHVVHGTLEVRVPDVQITLGATAAVVAVVHALVAWLADRCDQGREGPAAPTWRIAENRWRALRDGVHGSLADLVTGDPVPTDRRLHALLDQIEPFAPTGLDPARALVAGGGADALRGVGVGHAADYLIEHFGR